MQSEIPLRICSNGVVPLCSGHILAHVSTKMCFTEAYIAYSSCVHFPNK